MAELRIALIMGGGVSLGSFSAGALSQVLRLLEHVERGPAKIDVVTGASAGSMTLGVMLYHMFRGSSLNEMEEALRSAWVERISFDELCPDLSEHRVPSLFSDRIVRSIATEQLNFERWAGDGPAHPYFAEGAVVSFALTNMNGIPVRAEGQMIRQASGGEGSGRDSVFADAVQTTFHDDVIRFVMRRNGARPAEDAPLGARLLEPWTSEEKREEWEIFREAAIASGAFPAAFPPVRIPRRRSEYSIWPEELERDAFTFDYVDGGVLRNEPLREAIQLAGERDAGQDVERVFILIDPNVSGTRELYPLGFNQSLLLNEEVDEWGEPVSSTLEAPDYMGKLTGVLGRLLSVLTSQATFRDWLRAARVNSQIEWRDELTEIVGSLEPRAGSDAEGAVDRLLEKIYRDKVARGAGSSGSAADPALVRERIARDLRKRAGTEAITFTTKLFLLVDLVANLREKRKLNMVAVTPASGTGSDPLPIAGNFLSNFGGFFNREYRTYDFSVGEYLASEVLTTPIPGARRFVRDSAPTVARPNPPLPDPAYRNLSAGIQQKFEKLVAEHAKALAPRIGLPGFLHGVFAGKIRDKVRSALVGAHPGQEGRFVVQITGARNLFLTGARGAKEAAADGSGRISTIVAARMGGDGSLETSLVGPHLSRTGDGPPHLELRQKRFLRPSRHVATVRLDGPPEAWLRRARYSGVPLLRVELDGEQELTVTPERLTEAD